MERKSLDSGSDYSTMKNEMETETKPVFLLFLAEERDIVYNYMEATLLDWIEV